MTKREEPPFVSDERIRATQYRGAMSAFMLRDIYEAELSRLRTEQPKWISIDERLPKDRQKVIIGHAHGKWVRADILFADLGFRVRVNADTGGDAGYKQKDWKKENGDPAGPDEWRWGHSEYPTHWQPYPEPPSI